MTGQEHREYAADLLDEASADECGSEIETYRVAAAHAHATIAVAAAIEAQNELIVSAVRELAKLAPSLLAVLAKGGGE